MTNPDTGPGPLTRLELEQIAANQQKHRDYLERRQRRAHQIPDDTPDPDPVLDRDGWVDLIVQVATIDSLDGLASLPQTRDEILRGFENRGEYGHALALCEVSDELLNAIVDEVQLRLLFDELDDY